MTDVQTRHRGDTVLIIWNCVACGNRNERDLSGCPWFCDECGHHDRDVEIQTDHIHDVEHKIRQQEADAL